MDSMKNLDEIEGVIIQPLKQIADNRGSVLHMLKNDSSLFKQFGEVYFSEIHSGTKPKSSGSSGENSVSHLR